MTPAQIAALVYLGLGVPFGALLTVHLREQVDAPQGGRARTLAVWALMAALWLPYLALLGLASALEDLGDDDD